MSHYSIRCRKCGKTLENAYCAFCEHCNDALLVTEYRDTRFERAMLTVSGDSTGFRSIEPHSAQPGPVVYRSQGLAQQLGLEKLYIAFNGYWPEKGALLETCTFKEFEAAVVLQNARENGVEGLIVASAGQHGAGLRPSLGGNGLSGGDRRAADVPHGDVVS